MSGLRVCVEGGRGSRSNTSACREGFRKLFEKLAEGGSVPRTIVGGSRNATFDDFTKRLADGEPVLLLVDAEDALLGNTAWAHLAQRDGWQRPQDATEDHFHLMVRCMESWFLADRDLLRSFFGNGFHVGSLRGSSTNIEVIDKPDVMEGLDGATRHSAKGRYDKADHSFALLGRVDPARVRQASHYADRFFSAIEQFAQENPR